MIIEISSSHTPRSVWALINMLLNNRLDLGRVSIWAIDPFLFNLMSEICSSDACDGVSLPYCGSLSDPFSRDEVIWYLMWWFHPRKWWQHSLVVVWKPTGTNVHYILKNNNEFYVGFIVWFWGEEKKEGTCTCHALWWPSKSRYANTQCLCAVLISYSLWLVSYHWLQVACIHDSRTLCMPLPANMHHTLQRGWRNPSCLGQATLIYRA